MHRLQTFLIVFGCLIGIAPITLAESGVESHPHQREHPSKSNVLLICVDDLKPTIGCYGDSLVKTPNIDRLATKSVKFERAYCNQAVCSPSRNALLVGLRPQSLGIYDLATHFRNSKPDAVTLPMVFKANGYQTQSLGKIFHVGQGNHDDEQSWSLPSYRAKAPQYALKSNQPKVDAANPDRRGTPTELAEVSDNFYADGATAQEAIQRLKSLSSATDQPFFMALGFVRPHLPFVAPKKYWDLYDRQQIPLASFQDVPAGAPSYAPQFGGELRNYEGVAKQGRLSEEQQRELIHGYFASISYMDHQLGLVLDELERTGMDKNTLVVFWGDHGWHLGDHGMWCKHSNYEQATRIPLLISGPGIEPQNSQAWVETVDIYPTLCELAGLQAPKDLDGKSLAPVLKGESNSIRDHVIHVYPRNKSGVGQLLGRAIRTDRYRLVEWKPFAETKASEVEYELYDYEVDPFETKNLAPSNPEIVATLQKLLAKHPAPRAPVTASSTKTNNPNNNDRNKLFERKDADKDGQLTKDEFLRNQPDPDKAPQRFTQFDANGDGSLSREEFVSSGKLPSNAKKPR